MEQNGGESGNSQRMWGTLKQRWESWISLNSSWSNRWWYASVHILTATIGAGVLSLHTAMAALGWEIGIILLLWFIVLSLICYSQMVDMHELGEQRMDRYSQLSKHVLGEKLGFWLVVPLQTIVIVMVDIVYLIAGGSSLQKIFAPCSDPWYWILGFGCIQILLSHLPNLASLTWISVMATFAAIGYSTFAWIAIVSNNPKNFPYTVCSESTSYRFNVCSEQKHEYYDEGGKLVFSVFSALGQLAFACSSGQNIAVEVQATIPSLPHRPSKVAMWLGVLIAYSVVAFCYIPVAVAGYWFFGNDPPIHCMKGMRDCHLLLALYDPRGLVLASNILLVLHLCGSYQVYAMPLFESFEDYINNTRLNAGKYIRLLSRSIYVIVTTLIAMGASPFFGALETIVGGLANMPTSYIIPGVLWHLLTKPRRLSLKWMANMLCIVFGLTVMVTSTIGAIQTMIDNWADFRRKYDCKLPPGQFSCTNSTLIGCKSR